MADGTHGTGPNNSASASDTASGNGAVNPGDIERMINDAVSKALGPRLKRERSSMEEMIAARVSEALKSLGGVAADSTASPANVEASVTNEGADAQTSKRSIKAVDTELQSIKAELAKERQARAHAEQRAAQEKLQADLRNTFAKYAGADNPHVPAYLSHYASQFKHVEGQTYRVTRNEFGEETLIPLDTAAESLFSKDGELKHLVPSRSPGLPPTGMVRGMPLNQGANNGARGGIFEREILHAQAMTDPAVYDALHGPKK